MQTELAGLVATENFFHMFSLYELIITERRHHCLEYRLTFQRRGAILTHAKAESESLEPGQTSHFSPQLAASFCVNCMCLKLLNKCMMFFVISRFVSVGHLTTLIP